MPFSTAKNIGDFRAMRSAPSFDDILRLLLASQVLLSTPGPTWSFSPMSVPPPPEPFRLGYVTDVEGNLEYFSRFCALSNVLDLHESPSGPFLTLRDGCHFVYGGDAVDRGPGDIRLCRALASLKRRHPDRVFLLVGNRDLNKLRLSAELSDDDLARTIDEIPPPHWDPSAPTLRAYLAEVARSRGLPRPEDADSPAERLRYMLRHTLGCPDTFEFRREELAVLRGVPVGSVGDGDVLRSFRREAGHPDGSLRGYLEAADVAAVVGHTLFVHGAADARTVGFVPRTDSRFELPKRRPPPGRTCDGVHEWASSLNAFLRAGLADHRARPNWDPGRTTRGGEALLALQNRAAMWGRSVVSNCYGDGGCVTSRGALRRARDPDQKEREAADPLAFESVCSDPRDPEAAAWLRRNGIRRVVVGHRPTGDCPAVLAAGATGVEIISGDTSYADPGRGDGRGRAVAVLEVVGRSAEDSRLEISGRLRSGEAYRSVFHRLHGDEIDETVGDGNLGVELDDGYWVKASTAEHYHLCRGEGRKVEYSSVPIAEMATKLKKDQIRE